MLTGRYEPIPGEGENVTPTTWNSMGDAFKSSFQFPFLLTPGMASPDRKELRENVSAMQQAADAGDQGWGQKTANWFAGFAGGALNPYSLMLGEVGGAVASKAVSSGAGLIGKYAPLEANIVAAGVAQKKIGSIVGENVPKFVGDTTVGGLAKGAVSGFAIGTGFSLPQEVANTYDAKNDSFNWWGGVKSSFADGGIGLGLMSVPYLAGTLWGKMFRGLPEEVSHADMPLPHEGKVPEGVEPSHPALAQINQAETDGKLTASHAQWFRDYVTGGDTNENLNNRAIELLIKDGQPVDAATKRVLYKIFSPEDIDHLQTSLADKMASTVPENMKGLLSQFMINGTLDEMRGRGNMLHGLQGVTQFIRKRLQFQPEEMVNFHNIMRRLLPENMKEENPFTHKKIYQAEKSSKSLGVSIPHQVERRLKQEEKIKRIKQQNKDYQREFERTGKARFKNMVEKNEQKMKEMEERFEPLLEHKEEIEHLREKLLPNGKAAENFKAKRAYDRLSDLTRVSNGARKLMHELHVTHEYEMHEHYANFLEAITKVMRASVGKLADPNNVLNYMKDRLVREVPDLAKIEKVETKAEAKIEKSKEAKVNEAGEKVDNEKAFKDEVINTYDEEMKNAPKEIKEEYEGIANQFKEFAESEGIFKNLIRCVEGTLNG